MTRIAVTGANGFVGRELVATLLRRHTVRCILRSADRSAPGWRGRVETAIVGSVNSSTDWDASLAGVDAIVHLAAVAHKAGVDPDVVRQTNVEGTRHLAQTCARLGVRRLVFISSIGVHGNSTTAEPISESSEFCPYDHYSRSKVDAENEVRAVAAASDLETVIVRPPLVYGPGAPGNFGRLVSLVLAGWPLPFKSIQNRRSLVSVRNLCSFIECAIAHPCAAGQAFVACDGQDMSLPGLIREIAEASGRPVRIFRFSSAMLGRLLSLIGRREQYEKLTGSLQVDAGKAARLLDWTAPESVRDGIRYAVTRSGRTRRGRDDFAS